MNALVKRTAVTVVTTALLLGGAPTGAWAANAHPGTEGAHSQGARKR